MNPNVFPRWQVKKHHATDKEIAILCSRLGVSPLIIKLLLIRGLETAEEMDIFLNPGLRHLAPLEEWPGLLPAAQYVASSLKSDTVVGIWGDYDVDGISSTALLTDFFRQKNIPVTPFIPDRQVHGYGLSQQGLEELAAKGVKLLITVDCGISDVDNIQYAGSLGMDVVVTDHHLPGDTLPDVPLINPRLGDCPCPHLAGVGVAFLFAAALNRMIPGQALDMRQFLDLVALGTIADVVPLHGQNRVLVKNGLLLLDNPKRPGLTALKRVCSFAANAKMGAGEVSFGLAPRINAAGRMENATHALELLLTSDQEKALELAETLDGLNSKRKKQENIILEQACSLAEENQHQRGLVLFNQEWHQGIIGIVASRIVEKYHKPCLMLCRHGDVLKGSGRSVNGVDLHSALCFCKEALSTFGGHRLAAGLTLEEKNLPLLRDKFEEAVTGQMGSHPLPAELTLDDELGFKGVDVEVVKEIDCLQPFGMGNPRPLFLSPPLLVLNARTFGQGKHLGLELRDETANVTLRGQLWRQADSYTCSELMGKKLTLAYSPKLSFFNGLTTIDVTIKTILDIQ